MPISWKIVQIIVTPSIILSTWSQATRQNILSATILTWQNITSEAWSVLIHCFVAISKIFGLLRLQYCLLWDHYYFFFNIFDYTFCRVAYFLFLNFFWFWKTTPKIMIIIYSFISFFTKIFRLFSAEISTKCFVALFSKIFTLF